MKMGSNKSKYKFQYPQVKPNHYFVNSYDSKGRFISYWYQINEIIKLNPKKVLEIGIGNGFVSKYLKERKVNILSFICMVIVAAGVYSVFMYLLEKTFKLKVFDDLKSLIHSLVGV